MCLIQSMVMYKPLFQDSIIAVSIAVRYTIAPKLVIGDATFYYIASLLKNVHDIPKIPFFAQILTKWGPFWVPRFF